PPSVPAATAPVCRPGPPGGLAAPRPADERARRDALEERRVDLEPRRALLDDVQDVVHRYRLYAAEIAEIFHVLDDVLVFRVLRGAGLGERSAVDDHVVLHVL